ncbi:hypothetical protein EXIGLDRAFT_593871, partial [Exidia glandulosa HHB12029]
RQQAVHRARAFAYDIFDDRARHIHTSADRKLHFARLIGYVPNSPDGPYYSAWHVPVIHLDESAKYCESKVFLHP